MILRAAIVFLLMLNVGVAAWWLGGAGQDVGTSALVINTSQPGLRLVNEPVAAKHFASLATTTLASMPAPTTSLPDEPPATADATPPVPAAAPALCLSFGPFSDAVTRDAARPRLQSLAQKLVARDAQARSARGWRVYMPALASRDAAQGVVEQIKAGGINDLYIIANGDEANSIALGRYGSEESARRRQQELAAKGFTARAEPLGETPPQWWLDARFPIDASRATLAGIAPSKPLDCARLP